jgi:hypothetical protein
MFKEVMNDLWLARISSLSNEVGLYVVLLKDEILANHRSFMTSLNIPCGKESEDLPYLYWIPKLHKTPYKERYIAGSST